LDGDWLILSKLGAVQVVLHQALDGRPKTVTLTRAHTGKWFACFSVESAQAVLPEMATVVGIDVGLASFATLSNGEQIENPRFLRRDEADVKRVQRKKVAALTAQNWPENAHQKQSLPKFTSGLRTGAWISRIRKLGSWSTASASLRWKT
jgi:transposase